MDKYTFNSYIKFNQTIKTMNDDKLQRPEETGGSGSRIPKETKSKLIYAFIGAVVLIGFLFLIFNG